MRKLMVLAVGVAAALVACENKAPVGPGTVTVTQTTSSTTTTSIQPPGSTTTTTTTTTTTVPGSLSRRYVAFPVVPNAPADMTLFFQLLTANGTVATLLDMIPLFGPGVTENEYKVTGVYVMGNGTTGQVDGELGDALNPLETGGNFDGTMTAQVTGCTAERVFRGALSGQNLQWGGGPTLRDCAGSPLGMSSFSMVRGDVPLPTTTVPPGSTTTSSSTTSTTTSTITCNYTLSPTSASFTHLGGQSEVVIGTLPACAWTAQSFAPDWLSVAPTSGTGPAAVTFRALVNQGAARSGTLVIAGQPFTVSQSAAPADLAPAAASQHSCEYVNSRESYVATVYLNNIGYADAGSSLTRVQFVTPRPSTPRDEKTNPVPARTFTSVAPSVPFDCFNPIAQGSSTYECRFTVTADVGGAVAEAREDNNVEQGFCRVSIPVESNPR